MGAAAGTSVFCDSARPGCGRADMEVTLRKATEWAPMEVTNNSLMDGDRIDPWTVAKDEASGEKVHWNCMSRGGHPKDDDYVAVAAGGGVVSGVAGGGFALVDEQDRDCVDQAEAVQALWQDGFEVKTQAALKQAAKLKAARFLGPSIHDSALPHMLPGLSHEDDRYVV
mmetsp:Transcript_94692/g.294991  ORF Transcript_94692/g.294991 Transcript_94692/m.294991 type:complete len:169 (-) Transcript_94692:110-616(-)